MCVWENAQITFRSKDLLFLAQSPGVCQSDWVSFVSLVFFFSFCEISAGFKHSDDISMERAWSGLPLVARVPFIFTETV